MRKRCHLITLTTVTKEKTTLGRHSLTRADTTSNPVRGRPKSWLCKAVQTFWPKPRRRVG